MKKLILLLVASILFTHCVISQVFEEQTDIQIQGINEGKVIWGDINNDTLLDFIILGKKSINEYYSGFFKNIENESFEEYDSVFSPCSKNSIDLGDYNNDNLLDIIYSGVFINGYFYEPVTQIYKNKNNFIFEIQNFLDISQVFYGGLAWGDFSNDAYLDFFQSGYYIGDFITKIYKSNKNNSFTEIADIEIDGVMYGSICWGDYNNDGYLDFIYTGETGYKRVTKIYKNNKNNSFTPLENIELTNVAAGNIEWGDYNNDGYLDILLTGQYINAGENICTTKIYKNNKDDSFSELLNNTFVGISQGEAMWGDYNNDGLLDIFLTGYSQSDIESKLYKNYSNDTFFEQTNEVFQNVGNSSVSWGDYNNDLKLDILLCGFPSNSIRISKIYKNNTPVANIRPNVITNLQTEIVGNDVYFSWDEATDPNQPSAGLNYNIYVYEEANQDHIISGDTVFDGLYIASPQAFSYYHELNGKRLMPKRGYIQGIRENGRVTYFLKGVFENCKTYYWSVQAIDASFEGGEFAPEQSFFFETSPVPDSEYLPLLTATCSLTVTTIPTATDVCMGTITATTTDPLEYDIDGYYTITWNYLGGNGNVVSQIQHVLINDNTPVVPDIQNLPVLSGECSVTVTDIPTATDNCSGVVTATTTDPMEYTEQGNYTITWQYDDGNGNVTMQNQQVVVEDNTPPSIICPEDITINLQQGQTSYTVTGTEFDPENIEDNCGIVNTTNNYNNTLTLDCSELPIGTTTITWTATDTGGNTSDCSLNIQINEFVGISNSFETGIKIYPNPTSGILNIEGLENDSKIEITDVTGKIIYTTISKQSTIKIDLSDIVSGIYILKVFTKTGIFSSTITIL